MLAEPVVEIRHLHKSYGTTIALDDVSLRVRRGEVVGLLGPSGSGKTTVAECAAGLCVPDAGTVRLLGHDPVEHPGVRHRVGVRLQHVRLPDRMTVRDAVSTFAAARGVAPGSESGLLRVWGLDQALGTTFETLSARQRARLFTVLALLGEPRIVILDEPTTGLDPAARHDTWKLVRAMRERGTAVLLVTHAMDEAEMLCDRLAVLQRGRIVGFGTPEQLRGEHRSLETAYRCLTGRNPIDVG